MVVTTITYGNSIVIIINITATSIVISSSPSRWWWSITIDNHGLTIRGRHCQLADNALITCGSPRSLERKHLFSQESLPFPNQRNHHHHHHRHHHHHHHKNRCRSPSKEIIIILFQVTAMTQWLCEIVSGKATNCSLQLMKGKSRFKRVFG